MEINNFVLIIFCYNIKIEAATSTFSNRKKIFLIMEATSTLFVLGQITPQARFPLAFNGNGTFAYPLENISANSKSDPVDCQRKPCLRSYVSQNE